MQSVFTVYRLVYYVWWFLFKISNVFSIVTLKIIFIVSVEYGSMRVYECLGNSAERIWWNWSIRFVLRCFVYVGVISNMGCKNKKLRLVSFPLGQMMRISILRNKILSIWWLLADESVGNCLKELDWCLIIHIYDRVRTWFYFKRCRL